MHLWQYNNEIIISQFCDTSGDTNKQLIPDRTCINFDHMVYHIYELRWASSDNTLKELDASGSFFIVICAWLYCIVISIQYFFIDTLL